MDLRAACYSQPRSLSAPVRCWDKTTLARVTKAKDDQTVGGALLRRRMVRVVRLSGFPTSCVGRRAVFSPHDPARDSYAASGAVAGAQSPAAAVHVGAAVTLIAPNREYREASFDSKDLARTHDSPRGLGRTRGRALDLAHSVFVRGRSSQ